jgi:hypothetical protein
MGNEFIWKNVGGEGKERILRSEEDQSADTHIYMHIYIHIYIYT